MRLPIKHTQILTLLLVVLIATPCSIKKMYANFIGIEVNLKNASATAKLQCQAFVNETADRKAEKTAGISGRKADFIFAEIIHYKGEVYSTPHFLFIKEKVPSYLLYRTLLI